jgi:hypothetical protein
MDWAPVPVADDRSRLHYNPIVPLAGGQEIGAGNVLEVDADPMFFININNPLVFYYQFWQY